MKTTKRLLSLVLCLVMLIGMLPAQVSAADEGVVQVDHNGTTTYYASLQEAFDGFAPSINTYGGTYVITLLGDTTGVSKNLQYPTENLDITLDLNGHTITGDGTAYAVTLNVGNNGAAATASGTVTVKDSSGNNSGKITGGKGGLNVYGKGATLNFQGGTVTENHGASKGGGIQVGTTTFLNMTGGVVSNNSVTGSSSANSGFGGGIFANWGSITGGVVTGNVANAGSHAQSGRGGGLATDITRTSGYNTLTIGDGIIYGNSAGNAGDDLMIQSNGLSSTKHSLYIGTENWWIDGWNGPKATAGNGETDRFNSDEPVAYTDGGFENAYNISIGLKYWEDPYDGPIYMITYTDGVEDEVVFEDQTYKGRTDKATPAFKGTPERRGYVFAGWSPEVEEIPTQDMVYTAQWTALTPYTVTYTDGVEGEEVFPDQVYDTFDTYETPAFEGTPTREHYIFTGWTPELADTVTESVTYVANWREAEVFTVTYTDGVEDEEIFADQVFTVEEQQATPSYTFDGKRPGYYFSAWTPTVAKVVTGDATYTAKWTTCTHSDWGTPVFDEEALTNTYTCVKCGQVKVVSLVAEIAGTRYETLQAALTSQARTTGDVTVKLLADTTETVTMTWYQQSKGQNLTIDLNGHTVTGTGSAAVMTFKRSGNTSSYKWNIIIDDTSESKSGGITGGKGTSGGAITVSNVKTDDSLTINGGNFTGNTATGNGGAIYANVSGFDVTVNGGSFSGNTATGNGGAISASTLIINGGTFKNNTAENATYGGGAVYCSNTLTVTGGTFTGNTAAHGGAIYVTASKPIVNVTGGAIYGNTATAYGDDIVFKCTGAVNPTFNLMAAADMGVDGITNWYVDGYKGSASADRYSETVTLYETPTILTKSTFALKAASHYTITYVDGVEDEVVFEDHVVLAAPGGATPEFVPEREGYDFLGWTPEVAETVTADATYAATWRESARGDINGVTFRGDNEGLSLELHDVLAYESIAVKVYSGETLLTTVSLRDIEDAKQFLGTAQDALTVSIRTYDESTYWAATEWTPMEGVAPTKYELYIDGALADTLEETVDADGWNALLGTMHPDQLEVPDAPTDSGSNATAELITVICDSDHNHTAKTYGWADPAANIVFPVDSEPVWDDELKAWTIGVRIDSIETYYVNLRFSEEYNDIQHRVVGESTRIDTTLVWDSQYKVWKTLTGEPFEVHVTCQTAPEAPSMGYHLSKFQIKMVGTVDGEEKVWFETLHLDTLTVGEVKGSRTEGFTVDITVALDDSYIAAWTEKHAPDAIYAYAKDTPATVTFTMSYTGDTTGELYDGPEYWAPAGDRVYTVSLAAAPDGPSKYGENVTPDLVQVICDSDPDHAPKNIKWQFQSTKVYPGAEVEWDAELGAWKIKVRIDSVSVYYVWLNYEKDYNDILHPMVDEEQKCIDTYLKWDEEQQLWVTLDGQPIAVHVACQTAPDAPTAKWLSIRHFQIKVKGDLDGDGIYGESKTECALGVSEVYTSSATESAYTVGQVYGNRKDGFFVDVTITLEDGDSFITTWIEKRDPGHNYVYNWEKTPKTFTFTLEYAGDLTGTLYGDGINDWVNTATGKNYGAIGEAYIDLEIPEMPAAPEQANVTEKLVAVICDSDGERHETVYGKWYPLGHCQTTSDIVWDAELKAWTVDVRIGSLYIMYVDQLEDANGGTIHELVEDVTTVYSTLVWDAAQNLWVPEAPIELHTTCRTAPVAPSYNQLKSYQVKVWGELENELKAYTTSIQENGYTLGQVYGSREEGFFVDVTVTLEDGDIFLSTWNEKRDPCRTYVYDWTKTEKTVTFTLVYNGSLTGTLHGERHAVNTNYDWILNTGKHYGVIYEAYAMVDEDGATYHEYESVVTEPTCTEAGYTTHTCTVCGDVVVDTEVPALGHTMGEWTVTKEPSYSEEGEKSRYCQNDGCDYVETEALDKLPQLETPAITSLAVRVEGIEITWGAVEGAERYRVYVKENGKWKNLGTTTGTTWMFTAVESGETYTFTVRCVNDANTEFASGYNNTGWSRTFVAAPIIVKMENTENGVKISWDAVVGANQYRVFVKTPEKWATLANTTATSYTWTGAESGETYIFNVRCLSDDGTKYISFYYTDGWVHTYYGTPAITDMESVYGGLKLTWTAIEGVDNYRVYVKNDKGTWTSIGDATGNSFVWTGAEADKTYTFTVRGRNAENTDSVTGYSNTGWSCTYVPADIPVPTVTALESTTDGVKLTWDAIDGVTTYRVYVKNDSGVWTSIGDATGTTFTWTGAEAGKTYTFTVRGRNAENTASATDYNKTGWSVKYTPVPAITELESTAEGVKLTWTAINGVSTYRVYVKNDSGVWTSIGDATGNSFVWTGAENGKTYSFTVRGRNAENTASVTGYNNTGWSHTFAPVPEITNLENTAEGIKLTWGAINGVTNYRVYVKNDKGVWTVIGDSTGNTFTYAEVEAGVTYTFTVRGRNAENTASVTGYNNTGWSIVCE